MPMRRPICIRISSGPVGGRRRDGSACGSAARSLSPSSPLGLPCSPRSTGARRKHSASAPSTRSRLPPRQRTASCSTSHKNSATWLACLRRRSRTSLIASRQLQDQLLASGESTPDLRYSQAVALDEVAKTFLTLGDTQNALDAAKKGRDILQDLSARDPKSMTFNEICRLFMPRSETCSSRKGICRRLCSHTKRVSTSSAAWRSRIRTRKTGKHASPLSM